MLAVGLRPNRRHTYGWQRASIVASFGNAALMLVVMGALIWEALHRLRAPVPVQGTTVMIVAGVGVAVNGATAFLFMSGIWRPMRWSH
jgi:cobalt-zinc-cadmium efflux system protein